MHSERTKNDKKHSRSSYSTFDIDDDGRSDDATSERSEGETETRSGGSFLGIPREYWRELYAIFDFAWTIIVNNTASNLIPTMSLMFSGKLGVDELGAVGLANTVLLVFGTRQTAGLSTACDTCFAQTFGSSRKKDMGIYFQKSLMVLGLFLLPCWAIHINAESLLLLIGTDPHVAYLAGQYLLITLPVIMAHLFYWVIFKYVRCQGFTIAPMTITVFGLMVNVAVQYVMVNVIDLGTIGSALSYVVNYTLLALLMLTWWFLSGVYKPTWSGWSMDAFQDWGMFFSLSVAGMLMVQLQWWGFELGTLTAGLLGKVTLGAQSIVFQVENIGFMIPNGIGIAANIRVGQQLGANDPEGAKRSVKCAFGVIAILSVFLMTTLLSIRTYIPMIFSNDSEVIALASDLIIILALYNVFDGICAGSAGMLRGCGKQHEAAAVVFIGMYMIGLPLGFSLMFLTEAGMAGYWYGLTVGLVLESFMYLYIMYRIDWFYQAEQAQMRSKVAKSKLKMGKDGETGETETLVASQVDSQVTLRHPSLPIDETSSSELHKLLAEHVPGYLTNQQLLYRRLLTLVCFLLPLVAGLLCRLYVAPPYGCVENYDNSSLIDNGTRVVVSDNTTWPIC